MDNYGYVVAAYVVTLTFVAVYTWLLERRLRRARLAVADARHTEAES